MIIPLLLAALVACDPALTALFAPHSDLGARLGTHPGRYEVCTTAERLDTLVPPGTAIEALEPLDALGAAGSYDRFAVVRLYGGRRARIARAWAIEGGEFVSRTYISPYPDATLTRLVEGTMTIAFHLAGDKGSPGSQGSEGSPRGDGR